MCVYIPFLMSNDTLPTHIRICMHWSYAAMLHTSYHGHTNNSPTITQKYGVANLLIALIFLKKVNTYIMYYACMIDESECNHK